MALPDDVIIEIFEYLEFPQIWQLQYLNKSLRKLMKEHRWNQIFYSHNLTDDILIDIIKNWNICKIELFGFCDNLNDKSLKQLGGMEYINLCECYQLTDESVKEFGNVKYLNLYTCCQITDKSVKKLGNVIELNLNYCGNVTDKSVKELKNVKKLTLYWCNSITDDGIKDLKNIEELDICGCSNITNSGIMGLKKLKSLHIDDLFYFKKNTKITKDCVKILKKRGVRVTEHI